MAGAGPASKPIASIGAASVGTVVVLISEALPEQASLLRSTLLYAAPVITVFARFVWLWMADWASAEVEKRSLDALLKEARTIARTAARNPASSPQHVLELQTKVEGLEKLRMELIHDRTATVRVRIRQIHSAATSAHGEVPAA